MKKEEIRKEFFKLRVKGHSHNQCRKILLAQFGYETCKRILQRWNKRLNQNDWDLCDKSKRPKTIPTKLTSEIEEKIIAIRGKTGWGENKISDFIPNVSHRIVNKILNRYHLTKPNPNRKKRIKYIRWQRKHINSLWQMDTSDQKIQGKYYFAVIDDCSRYCLGLFALNETFTSSIVAILDRIKKTMGHPHLKVGVCKAPCFLDDPKLKTVKLLPHSKECGFKFMDIK